MRNFEDLKIAVAGTGYVGLSIATLLSQHHKVMAVDIIPEKVEMINNKKSPIQDEYIEKYLAEKELDLTATLDAKEAYSDADFVVIAAPTNYDSKKNFFDTSAVEAVIKLVIEYNPEAIMVIKSTIPVGYTASVREKFHCDNIIFSPEFLRESKALYDNLYPSRIIVGTDVENARLVKAAHTFAQLLQVLVEKEGSGASFSGYLEEIKQKGIPGLVFLDSQGNKDGAAWGTFAGGDRQAGWPVYDTGIRPPMDMNRIPFPYGFLEMEQLEHRIIYYESSRG